MVTAREGLVWRVKFFGVKCPKCGVTSTVRLPEAEPTDPKYCPMCGSKRVIVEAME